MPDFQIRLFDADGALAREQLSRHDSSDQAAAEAHRLLGALARFEVLLDGKVVAHGRRT